MIIYPKLYCKKVTDITVEFLKENNIKALMLDVDNTLLDFELNVVEGLEKWYSSLKKENIKCIIMFATKPLKRGFKKAQKILGIDSKNIGVVGDQIFTDIIGANRSKMFPILVQPIAKKDLWMTRIKRPLEELVIRKYLKSQEGK